MALFPVYDKLPERRRLAGRARHRRQLRDDSMLDDQIRTRVCELFETATRVAHRRWPLDEMMVKIRGQRLWIWRAVDDEGKGLDVLDPKRRRKASAPKLLRKLLKHRGVRPQRVVTDGLASYRAALTVSGCVDRHRPGRLRDNWGGKLSPAHPPAATKNAAVQISGSSPSLCCPPWSGLQQLQRPASPDQPINTPNAPELGE